MDRSNVSAAAASLAEIMQRDIVSADESLLSFARVDNVVGNRVTITSGRGTDEADLATGAHVSPDDLVLVASIGRVRVVLAAIGGDVEVVEGDFASVIAALDEKVDITDYEVDQTTNALAHVTLQNNIDAKLAIAEAAELIRDTIASALVAGTNVTITPNDAGDTITIEATAGAGGVSSVNGETGAVTLSAADVGAVDLDDYEVDQTTNALAHSLLQNDINTRLPTADAPELIRDTMGTALAAGTNISVSVNDAGDTITISTPITTETIRDTIAAALVEGPNVTIVHDDAANTITISATGLDSKVDTSWDIARRLNANQNINTNVLTTIADFTIAAAPAGSVWVIEYTLRTGCNNTGGIRIANICSGGASLQAQYWGTTTSITALTAAWHTTFNEQTTNWNAVNSQNGHLNIRATVVVGASAADIILQMRNATAGQTGSILIGSSMLARRVA